MHVVQKGLGPIPETFEAYYLDGGDGAIAVGNVVCYKHDEDMTAQAGEFDELERFKVVVKPKTANLDFFAGVIVGITRRVGTGTNYSSFVRIQRLKHGAVAKALVKANATAASTVLKPVNDSWALEADATTDIATQLSRWSTAIAGETANTSSTAAVKTVYGVR